MRRSLFRIGSFALAAGLVFDAPLRVRANAEQEQAGQVQSNNQSESISERTERRGSQLLIRQTQEEADAKTRGCMSCHTTVDSQTMHEPGTVRLGCTDCHGGDASVMNSASKDSAEYTANKYKAHVRARYREDERSSANPLRANFGARWLKESAEWIKFVNPGDNRISSETCGRAGCHSEEVHQVRTSMMTHGAMLWEAALYNNGGYPMKNARFGESYSRDGQPQRLITWPPPTAEETKKKGILPFLDPLERWEISEPGNVLRVFERGGQEKGEIGNPISEEDPGHPDVKLSTRGFGTELRTDPVFLGLQKTRLFDPLLSFPGTNDEPGDYRQSGCSGCHVIYANDRDPAHSGKYAVYGNQGFSQQADPTIPKNEPGHPLQHVFTLAIPSSQCMVCHMHPGTNMVTTYYGYTWWDNEINGDKMYPPRQHDPSAKEAYVAQVRDPEGATDRGKWRDVSFLSQVGTPEFNKQLDKTQFADFHSHGWIFRAVYKHDREGNLLDADDHIIEWKDADKFKKAVHLADIHLEKGMQCADCHFEQDAHGNGNLYGESRNAIVVRCESCHGDVTARASLIADGPAAPEHGINLALKNTPFREKQFYWRGDRLYQRSIMDPKIEWEVVQVIDSITPGNPHYSEKSRLAKTIQKDGVTWGVVMDQNDLTKLAHSSTRMSCQSCHTSWTTSCFGCHLGMTANQRMPMLHNEGLLTRNYTNYDFMVLRDDVYMLGIDGTVTGNRVSPVRSACAVVVSSQNAQRDWLYYQQQTVSASGFSGQAFSPYVPHTVRAKETKQCTDCHISQQKDNNAWMAQVLVQGTNFLNFMGRYIYVATGGDGFNAVAVAEHDEPPAIYGSDFQKVSYPRDYEEFVKHKRVLDDIDEHPVRAKLGGEEVLDVQLRGEYLYAALGKGGYRIYDVAQIDNKDFSEKIVTAPVSPFGQKFYVKSKYATAIASPTTLGVDPLRTQDPENEEQKIHLLYGFLYGTDQYEGLIVIGNGLKEKKDFPGVGTLLDGNPANNFIHRALTFNPEGKLNGARRITIAGVYAYILCDRGLEVVNLDDPLHPKITAEIGKPLLNGPTGIAVQFRYAFVTDHDGLKVLDVTRLDEPKLVESARVPLSDARNVYVARTYAYVSDGKDGIAIVDVERPEEPRLARMFNANGALKDTRDLKIGMVSSSQFAFVADGEAGFKIVQLFSPADNDKFYGFSPPPTPKLIAKYKTKGPALAVSKGVDRDRAVDESGNQLTVFGRRGARPFTLEEMQRMYLRNGQLYTVTNDPPGRPRETNTLRAGGQ
ncbi:MAG: hypothetical protein JOZ10_03695 [Acidobacteria bacterium]|nr:hypothetical protein [Acidobacteriota bacterium]MBV9146810.1 hypothetical protein [Acidobacteriota bacterium]